MKILFYIVHPAQFYLFKNTIINIQEKGVETLIIIKDKDVLINLIENYGFKYYKLFGKRRKNSTLSLFFEMFSRLSKGLIVAKKFNPDLIVGTPFDVSYLGKILKINSLIVNEDDAKVIPKTAKLGYPYCTTILSPECCDNGKWEYKSIKYNSYHELAYLHPDNFNPDYSIVKKYLSRNSRYVLIRLAELNAHHDEGKNGISDEIMKTLVDIFKEYDYEILISAERKLPEFLEAFRISFDPSEMHHFMAFADLYIGDSQTMAAEAAVLGTPSIRYNDFVDSIGYLDELEKLYDLTYGIKTGNIDALTSKVIEFINVPAGENKIKRNKMLNEKINFERLLTWMLLNFPKSTAILKDNPDYQYNFRL